MYILDFDETIISHSQSKQLGKLFDTKKPAVDNLQQNFQDTVIELNPQLIPLHVHELDCLAIATYHNQPNLIAMTLAKLFSYGTLIQHTTTEGALQISTFEFERQHLSIAHYAATKKGRRLQRISPNKNNMLLLLMAHLQKVHNLATDHAFVYIDDDLTLVEAARNLPNLTAIHSERIHEHIDSTNHLKGSP